ncbi:MAG: FecR domain-containing protein [Sedimentisphaerales bacterium]|nr:FecR domain-containing protein [Sedimentisphaerales bacterium]
MDKQIQYQLEDLLTLAVEGQISEQQVQELNALIDQHPERIRYAVHYLQFVSLLKRSERVAGMSHSWIPEDDTQEAYMESLKQMARAEMAAPVVDPPPAEVPENPAVIPLRRESLRNRINKTAIYTAIAASAALLMLLSYIHLVPVQQTGGLGYLTSSVHAEWASVNGPIQQDKALCLGPMKLVRGLAEITMDTGATVIVQAPAEFELEAQSRVYLKSGRLVVSIENCSEERFVVRTPQATVVDLGTEFGVEIDAQGNTQTHVFQGEAELRSGSDPLKYGSALSLRVGQGGRSDAAGNLKPARLNDRLFVRKEQFDTELLADKGSPYHRWKAYHNKLYADPSLVAHYTFEEDASSPDRVLNRAPVTASVLDGVFGTDGQKPTWVQGRLPGKTAVRFERGKEQTIVIPADPSLSIHGPVTVSSWVYYPNPARMGGHLISCRQDYHVNFQFSIFDGKYSISGQRNQFELLRFNSKSDRGCYSRAFTQQAGVWYHFVMTHDTETAAFYVNGELFESKPYSTAITGQPTEVILGALKVDGKYILREGDFDGIVDELMVFNRSLAAAEIRRLYEAGQPDASQIP